MNATMLVTPSEGASLSNLEYRIINDFREGYNGFTMAVISRIAPAMVSWYFSSGVIAWQMFPTTWTVQMVKDILDEVRRKLPANNGTPVYSPPARPDSLFVNVGNLRPAPLTRHADAPRVLPGPRSGYWVCKSFQAAIAAYQNAGGIPDVVAGEKPVFVMPAYYDTQGVLAVMQWDYVDHNLNLLPTPQPVHPEKSLLEIPSVVTVHNIAFLPRDNVALALGAQQRQLDYVMQDWVAEVNKAYLSYWLASEALREQVGNYFASAIITASAGGFLGVDRATLAMALMRVPPRAMGSFVELFRTSYKRGYESALLQSH